jgi:hypothetical protein
MSHQVMYILNVLAIPQIYKYEGDSTKTHLKRHFQVQFVVSSRLRPSDL